MSAAGWVGIGFAVLAIIVSWAVALRWRQRKAARPPTIVVAPRSRESLEAMLGPIGDRLVGEFAEVEDAVTGPTPATDIAELARRRARKPEDVP